MFVIRGEDPSQPAQGIEVGEAGFVPRNRGGGGRLADVDLHNVIDPE